jgi:glycosyltransferase involved in cell wall biosynthesis
MRILYVTGNSHLRSTTSSLNAILRELCPRGLKPLMLFQEPGPWQQELAQQGIPCAVAPLRLPDKWHPIRSFLDLWRLIRLMRREKIELIHCNEVEHYPALRQAARFLRIPIVATLHFKIEPGFGLWAFRTPYTPTALQFISQAQLNYCRPALPPEMGPERVKLLMSGLCIDDFLARGDDGQALRTSWKATSDTIVVGTASSIRAHKKLEGFVYLISRLRARGLPVLGVIAGGGRFTDPPYLEKLEQLIRTEGIDRHCLLLGNLDPLTPFLKAIDLFVSTSEWETFGMSICEAMACGKPTLAYAVGGNPEAVPDPWYVAPYPDLDQLEEKAIRLITDPAFRLDAGALAQQHVRTHFDSPALAARQAAIYEEILGRKLAPASTRPTLVGSTAGREG